MKFKFFWRLNFFLFKKRGERYQIPFLDVFNVVVAVIKRNKEGFKGIFIFLKIYERHFPK